MGNMLFKTNRNLFVRNYIFNLPRKVDTNHEKMYMGRLQIQKFLIPQTFLKLYGQGMLAFEEKKIA